MNREYTVEQFRDVCDSLLRRVPGARAGNRRRKLAPSLLSSLARSVRCV